uniref:Uncharacterized protein n=1 Tax=Equus asinus asinus TaxID=83772 RepID=A0A8C4MWN6_EQUAS
MKLTELFTSITCDFLPRCFGFSHSFVFLAFLLGFTENVKYLVILFPLSCIGSRSFCFLIRCPPNWVETSRYLLPTEKCFRKGK